MTALLFGASIVAPSLSPPTSASTARRVHREPRTLRGDVGSSALTAALAAPLFELSRRVASLLVTGKITAVHWLVTLSGSSKDLQLLAGESLPGVAADSGTPNELILELDDPEGDARPEEAALAAKAVIDSSIRHINGFGRLRWGRTFEGVSISAMRSFDSAGGATEHVFVGSAVGHMLYEDFAAMVERLGHARPAPPAGLEVINALDGAAVTALAETNPDVGRVLHLVDLMLEGDDEIDWVAGYSALEAIEHDLGSRQMNGRDLGWWTNTERDNFRATANSVEVLGARARHGKPFGLTQARMTANEGSWFVRRAAAHWVTHLREANNAGSDDRDDEDA